jgi:hypothetical protein
MRPPILPATSGRSPAAAALLALLCAGGCGEEKVYTSGLIQGARAAETQDTRQKLETIGAALERYAMDHSGYPQASSLEEAEAALAPGYLRSLPRRDGWGRPLRLTSQPESFSLRSDGQDGQPGTADDLGRESGGRVGAPVP